MIVCLRDYKNEYGQFMKFEPLTLVPFDLSAIDLSLLTITEKKYLNEYHSLVYEKISQYLSKSDREWLKNETRAV
jgi:Xaa-Pro aminopeptidase